MQVLQVCPESDVGTIHSGSPSPYATIFKAMGSLGVTAIGVIMVGVGIPLSIAGARKVPVVTRRETRVQPVLVLGPTSAALRLQF